MIRRCLAILTATALVACQTPQTQTPSAKPSGTETSTQSETWRKQMPKPGPEPQPSLPVFRRAKLKNGMTIMVSQNSVLPLVSFRLVIRGGSSADPQDAPGLTSFAFGLLDEGAGKRSALEFSDAIADLGASFSTGADQDSGWLSVSGLSRNQDEMMSLMADVLLRPSLSQKDFVRVQKQAVASLMQRRGSPGGLAFEYVPAMLYGARHPYGHPSSGTVESVGRFKLSQVRRHLPKLLTPHRACLIASGDISLEEATKIAEKFLGKWNGSARPEPKPPTVEPTKRSSVTLIHKPNSPQTMVIIFRPLFGHRHADETALVVTNEIYGGSFSSRLNLFLREEKGYTYGARASLSLRHNVGAYLAYAKIRQDVTGPGLQAFFDQMALLKTKSPSTEEIQRAKDGLTRSLTGQFESTGAAANAAETLFIYRLPLDRYAQMPQRYASVEKNAIDRAIERYLSSDVFHVVLVGDASKIQDEIKKLDLGPVKLITP